MKDQNNMQNIVLIILTIAVGFLFLSNSGTSLQSLFTKEQTPESYLGGDIVHIKSLYMNRLNVAYANAQVETVYCISGTKMERVFEIDRVEPAEVVYSDQKSVIFKKCDKGTIGTIHNHNNGVCTMSLEDAYTFGQLSGFPHDHQLFGIWCAPDKIVFYGTQSRQYTLLTQLTT